MLGAPSKVFYKTEDKMLIQRGSESEDINSVDNPDIFYNYFSLGLVSFDYLFAKYSDKRLSACLYSHLRTFASPSCMLKVERNNLLSVFSTGKTLLIRHISALNYSYSNYDFSLAQQRSFLFKQNTRYTLKKIYLFNLKEKERRSFRQWRWQIFIG
jgi:hypothetical protein